jgi:hypothetical protein
MQSGGVVIACGMAKFENDTCVAEVFERADQKMYENKKALKSTVEKETGDGSLSPEAGDGEPSPVSSPPVSSCLKSERIPI